MLGELQTERLTEVTAKYRSSAEMGGEMADSKQVGGVALWEVNVRGEYTINGHTLYSIGVFKFIAHWRWKQK